MTYAMKMREERKEGCKKGREEGRKEGLQEGMQEMIKNFLLAGTPVEYICKATNWTEDAVYRFMHEEPSLP